MSYSVVVKQGHPTGIYRRAGIEFHIKEPKMLSELPEAVASDPWLVVTEVEDQRPEKKKGKNKDD